MRWLLVGARWERAVLALIAALVAYQVFAEPIVGTADNRDWWRVMKQVGLAYRDNPDVTFFKSFQREYVEVPAEEVKYLTSQLLIARAAIGLSRMFGGDTFDIRWMGLVNSTLFVGAVAVFLAGFRKRATWIRITAGIASCLMFTDVRLVAYFNSFYCEPAQVIFLVAAIGFALLTVDDTRTQAARTWLYAGFLVSSVLFFFAKTQDLVFCVPFAVIAVWIFPAAAWWRRAIIGVFFVGLFVWGMKSDAYEVTHHVNVLVTVGEEILPHSRNQKKDLAELGGGDLDKVTFGRIARFYAHHPIRWWWMAKRRMHEAFTHAPFGNFEAPRTGESHSFDTFSNLEDRLYPRWLWLWVLAVVIYTTLLVLIWRRGDAADRTHALIDAMLVVGCIVEFIAVVTFEANGTTKHFFIFNVLVDIVLVRASFQIARVVQLMRAPRPVL